MNEQRNNNLFNNLNYLIKKKGLSLKKLSDHCDIPISTLHDWVSAPCNPKDLNALSRLSQFLEIRIDDLLFCSPPFTSHKISAEGVNVTIYISHPDSDISENSPTRRKQ